MIRSTGSIRLLLLLGLLSLLVGGVSTLELLRDQPRIRDWSESHPDLKGVKSEYATSNRCQACHKSEYQTWRSTYHRKMTQWSSKEAIIPEWNAELSHEGRTYRLFRRGDQFMVDMPRYGTTGTASGERSVQPVLMTTGSHHMQYYWLPVPWGDSPVPDEQRQTFKKHCSRCHGERGEETDEADAILDEALEPEQLDRFWKKRPHRKLASNLGEQEREQIARFVERINFPGRMMMFPFSFFVREKIWLHDSFTYLEPPDSPDVHEAYGNHWSDNCDACHSTNAEQGRDENNLLAQSHIVEIGIACESCHGPGKQHVERYKNPLTRYQMHLAADTEHPDDIINPKRLPAKLGTSVCAQCHSELYERGPGRPGFRPGLPIESFANVLELKPPGQRSAFLEEMHADEPEVFRDTFWPDGTVRIAGRDYNGMLVTKCYLNGDLACTTCHKMHGSDANDQLAPEAKGDDVCFSCHAPTTFANVKHTHHRAESSGSRCYNCHMPHTTWGLLNGIRAHRIDSPNISRSVETGRPNACNLCHLDYTIQQVASTMKDWYGHAEPIIPKRFDGLPASVVWMLEGNAVQRGILAWHMGWQPAQEVSGTSWMAPYLAQLLDDPYSAVRFAASRSLQKLGGFQDLDYDFRKPAQEQSSTVEAVVSRWEAQNKDPDVGSVALVLDRKRLAQMEARRDNTPLEVSE